MTLTLLFKYATTSTLEVHMLDDSNILACLERILCRKKQKILHS